MRLPVAIGRNIECVSNKQLRPGYEAGNIITWVDEIGSLDAPDAMPAGSTRNRGNYKMQSMTFRSAQQ